VAQGGQEDKEQLGGAGLKYLNMEDQGAFGELFEEAAMKMEPHEKSGYCVEKLRVALGTLQREDENQG